MKWFYLISVVLAALLISGYSWTQYQAAEPLAQARAVGLTLSFALCCGWPLTVGVIGWHLRRIVHEGWRPTSNTSQTEEQI
jgi:hypothetical protein